MDKQGAKTRTHRAIAMLVGVILLVGLVFLILPRDGTPLPPSPEPVCPAAPLPEPPPAAPAPEEPALPEPAPPESQPPAAEITRHAYASLTVADLVKSGQTLEVEVRLGDGDRSGEFVSPGCAPYRDASFRSDLAAPPKVKRATALQSSRLPRNLVPS